MGRETALLALPNQVITQQDLETGIAFTSTPGRGSVDVSTLPRWQRRMLSAPLAGPKHLFSLLHEGVCFNEAAFGSLAFYLSKCWPCAVWLCRGDLWHCRHLGVHLRSCC